MIRLAIAGATGRTGSRVLTLAARDDRFHLTAALTSPDEPTLGRPATPDRPDLTLSDTLSGDCDILIDFTLPEGTMAWLRVCEERRIPFVTGVTGHSDDQLARIAEAAKTIPILKASNFSVGIHLMADLVRELAAKLGKEYNVEIVEAHHHHKADAPSGTAVTLLNAVAEARNQNAASAAVYGRHGHTGARPPGEIGVHALRMGELVGRHEVFFSGAGETISVRHEAHSRDTFAFGALRAAAWLVARPPGLYGLAETMTPD